MNQIKKVFYNLFFKKKRKRKSTKRTSENSNRSSNQTSAQNNRVSQPIEKLNKRPKYDLSGLKTKVSETKYIENLRIGRSWILPQMVHMGFQTTKGGKWEFSIKKFENKICEKYNYTRRGRRELWEFLLRTYKVIAESNGNSEREKWWNLYVINDLINWDLYMTGKARRGLNRKIITNIAKIISDYRYDFKYSNKQIDPHIIKDLIETYSKYRMKKRDVLYKSTLPESFINAFKGDGAYNAMMTMVKILGLRLKNDNGKVLSRERCIQEIEYQASKLNGSQLLEYCKTQFFDSGVFEYERYV